MQHTHVRLAGLHKIAHHAALGQEAPELFDGPGGIVNFRCGGSLAGRERIHADAFGAT